MNILFAIIAGMLLLCTDSEAQKRIPFSIAGTVPGLLSNRMVYLEAEAEPGHRRDSAKIREDRSFILRSEVNDGGEILILKMGSRPGITLLVEGGETLHVAMESTATDSVEHYIVTGSQNMLYFDSLTMLRAGLERKVATWKAHLSEARSANETERIARIEKEYQRAERETVLKVKAMLPAMGASLAALYALNFINSDSDFDTYEEVAERFLKKPSNNPHAKALVDDVSRLKATAIGKEAPEITLTDTTGALVPLSSLRGQYVLIDFWASWCRPCRIDNPDLVQTYNKYRDRGFTIYSVSLDQAKSSWINAIVKDGMTWTNVSDLRFWKSMAVKVYGLKAIPATFLLDKEGRIIARNLRGPALSQKLEEVLSKK